MCLIFFRIETGGYRTDAKNTPTSNKDYLRWKKTLHRIKKRRQPQIINIEISKQPLV